MNEYWTPAQQGLIDATILDEIENSRLAHRVIPGFRLSNESVGTVSSDTYDYSSGSIDDTDSVRVKELVVNFSLPRRQTENADLTSALTRIRTATQELARRHDAAVFNTAIRDRIYEDQSQSGIHPIIEIEPEDGNGVIAATGHAIGLLDDKGYRHSYCFIAGRRVYQTLFALTGRMCDFPIEALRKGLLEGGPVHRANVLRPDEALVLSIRVPAHGGSPIDRAVAAEPRLVYQGVRDDDHDDPLDRRDFRLYERFVTRFKETFSVVLLRMSAEPSSESTVGKERGRTREDAGAKQ